MHGLPDFTVGGVIRRTFSILGRHFGDPSAAAVVLVALPNLASSAFGIGTRTTLDAAGQLRETTTTNISFTSSGGSVVVWLISLILYGMVVHYALCDLRGERVNLGSAVAASLKAFLPNPAISVLLYVAVVIGIVLLIVPAFMVECALLVVVPASMTEGTGITGAFGRSRALTSGHRWRIFGLLLIYVLLVIGVFVVALVGAALTIGLVGVGFWIFKVLGGILTAAISLIGSAGVMACYVELREAESGALGPEVADAFA